MIYLPNVLESSSFDSCSPFTPLTTLTCVPDTVTHQRSYLAGFIIVRVSNKLFGVSGTILAQTLTKFINPLITYSHCPPSQFSCSI